MKSNDKLTYWWDIIHVKTNSNEVINSFNERIDVYKESRVNDFVDDNYSVYCGDIEFQNNSYIWEYFPNKSLLLIRSKRFDDNYIIDRKEFISNFPIDIEMKRIVPNVDDIWKFISKITNNSSNVYIITSGGNIITLDEYGLDSIHGNYEYPIDYAFSTHDDKRKRLEFDSSPIRLKLPLYGKYKENYVQLFSNILL